MSKEQILAKARTLCPNCVINDTSSEITIQYKDKCVILDLYGYLKKDGNSKFNSSTDIETCQTNDSHMPYLKVEKFLIFWDRLGRILKDNVHIRFSTIRTEYNYTVPMPTNWIKVFIYTLDSLDSLDSYDSFSFIYNLSDTIDIYIFMKKNFPQYLRFDNLVQSVD